MSMWLFHRYDHIRSYIHRDSEVKGYPLELVVELTNRCNLNCKICPRDKMGRSLGDMSFNLFKKIVDEIKGKVEMVDLCFAGESLLNPEVFRIIKYAKENGIKTFVQTNCMNLDSDTAEKIIQSGLDLLVLSIDAYSEDVYKKIRLGGEFQKVVENAKNFLRMKNNNGGKPYTIAQMVYTQENKNEVKDFYSYWKKNGADAVRIKPFNSRAGLVDVFNVQFQNQKPCIRLWRGMAIYWDGKVVPCCMDYQGRYIVGDVNKESILDIWNSERMKSLRELHITGNKKESELCKNCEGYSAGFLKTVGSLFFDALTVRKLAPVWNRANHLAT